MIEGWRLDWIGQSSSLGWTEGKIYFTNEDGHLIDDDGYGRLEPWRYIAGATDEYTWTKVYIDEEGDVYKEPNPILIGGE